jgi:hypothetical protein
MGTHATLCSPPPAASLDAHVRALTEEEGEETLVLVMVQLVMSA